MFFERQRRQWALQDRGTCRLHLHISVDSIHLNSPPWCEIAPVTLWYSMSAMNLYTNGIPQDFDETQVRSYLCSWAGIIIFDAEFTAAFRASTYEELLTTDTCMAATEAISSDTDYLELKVLAYFLYNRWAHTSTRRVWFPMGGIR